MHCEDSVTWIFLQVIIVWVFISFEEYDGRLLKELFLVQQAQFVVCFELCSPLEINSHLAVFLEIA